MTREKAAALLAGAYAASREKRAAGVMDSLRDYGSKGLANVHAGLTSADPFVSGRYGAGLGALAGGIGGGVLGMTSKRKKSPWSSALSGALAGGATGLGLAGGYSAFQNAKAPDVDVTRTAKELFEEKTAPGKIVSILTGGAGSEGATIPQALRQGVVRGEGGILTKPPGLPPASLAGGVVGAGVGMARNRQLSNVDRGLEFNQGMAGYKPPEPPKLGAKPTTAQQAAHAAAKAKIEADSEFLKGLNRGRPDAQVGRAVNTATQSREFDIGNLGRPAGQESPGGWSGVVQRARIADAQRRGVPFSPSNLNMQSDPHMPYANVINRQMYIDRLREQNALINDRVTAGRTVLQGNKHKFNTGPRSFGRGTLYSAIGAYGVPTLSRLFGLTSDPDIPPPAGAPTP